MNLDRIVSRQLSTTTRQTRPPPRARGRRRAPVKCSQSAALGKGSVGMRALLSPGGARPTAATALVMPAVQKALTPPLQYSATGLPGEPVAPFIFSGDHTKRNS